MDVLELLKSVQAAYNDVEAKAAERDAAAKVYHAATEAHKAASDALAALQKPLNDLFGKATDSRVRQG